MTHVYYKYAIAAIIVFDLGRPATFESVVKVGASRLLTASKKQYFGSTGP